MSTSDRSIKTCCPKAKEFFNLTQMVISTKDNGKMDCKMAGVPSKTKRVRLLAHGAKVKKKRVP